MIRLIHGFMVGSVSTQAIAIFYANGLSYNIMIIIHSKLTELKSIYACESSAYIHSISYEQLRGRVINNCELQYLKIVWNCSIRI